MAASDASPFTRILTVLTWHRPCCPIARAPTSPGRPADSLELLSVDHSGRADVVGHGVEHRLRVDRHVGGTPRLRHDRRRSLAATWPLRPGYLLGRRHLRRELRGAGVLLLRGEQHLLAPGWRLRDLRRRRLPRSRGSSQLRGAWVGLSGPMVLPHKRYLELLRGVPWRHVELILVRRWNLPGVGTDMRSVRWLRWSVQRMRRQPVLRTRRWRRSGLLLRRSLPHLGLGSRPLRGLRSQVPRGHLLSRRQLQSRGELSQPTSGVLRSLGRRGGLLLRWPMHGFEPFMRTRHELRRGNRRDGLYSRRWRRRRGQRRVLR